MNVGGKLGIAAGAIGVIGAGAAITYAITHRDKTPDPNEAWRGEQKYDSAVDEWMGDDLGRITTHGSADSGNGDWRIMFNGPEIPVIEGTSSNAGMHASFNYGDGTGADITQVDDLTATRSGDGSLSGKITEHEENGDVSVRSTFDVDAKPDGELVAQSGGRTLCRIGLLPDAMPADGVAIPATCSPAIYAGGDKSRS